MNHYYWHDWYYGWGWFLWFGIGVLMLSNLGNWGYAYRQYRKSYGLQTKEAIDILNERFARGELARDDYQQMRLQMKK